MATTECDQTVTGSDPRTGSVITTSMQESSPADVDTAAPRRRRPRRTTRHCPEPSARALMRAFADALENWRDAMVATADRETALGAARLNTELTRTVHPFRFFADVVVDGTRRLREVPRATLVAEGDRPAGDGFQVGPMFTMIDADAVSDVVFDECFGPAAVIVRYRSDAELESVVGRLPPVADRHGALGAGARPARAGPGA